MTREEIDWLNSSYKKNTSISSSLWKQDRDAFLNDNKMTYCIKASCQHQNADELIMKYKSMPENQNHYVSILCFTRDNGVDTIFGSFDYNS